MCQGDEHKLPLPVFKSTGVFFHLAAGRQAGSADRHGAAAQHALLCTELHAEGRSPHKLPHISAAPGAS